MSLPGRNMSIGNVTIAASGARPRPETAFFMHTDEIRPRERDGRDSEAFYPSGCTAACCGAGPSTRVADDDRVDAALLDEPSRSPRCR